MRYLCVLLLIAVISVGAFAQGTAAQKPDARLDQKVTLGVSHVKLEDVCKQLTEKTGVTIKAGSGERDWKVRERKVTIQAKDVKLGAVMQEISKLLGFYLSKSGKEGEWAYLYWQDKKSRDLESEMLNADKEAAAERSKKLRQAMIDKSEDALKMTPEEALKKKSEDPLTAYLGGSKSGRGFAQIFASLAQSFPTEYELMLRGKRVVIPLQNSSSAIQQAAKDVASGGIVGAEYRNRVENGRGDIPNPAEYDPYQLLIMPVGVTDGLGILGLGGMVALSGVKPGETLTNNWEPFQSGNGMGVFVLMDANSKLGKLFGETLFAVDSGQSMNEANKKVQESIKDPAFLAEVLAKESPTEKNPPTDPRLTREIEIPEELAPKNMGQTLAGASDELGKAMAKLSAAIGCPILLESFTGLIPPVVFITPGKQPLYKVMIACEQAGMSRELTDDDTLRLRPTDWAVRRSHEVPESFIAYYKGLIEKQGMLTFDDLAGLAGALSDGQITYSLLVDPDLRTVLMTPLAGDMNGSREILRFYDSLSARQKPALKSETGLPFAELSAAQWERFGGLITERLGGVYIVDGSVRLIPPATDLGDQSMVTWQFQTAVWIADEKDPREVTDSVRVWTEKGMEPMRASQKAAEERQNKAAEEQQMQAEPAK